jgi:hypothetical protein
MHRHSLGPRQLVILTRTSCTWRAEAQDKMRERRLKDLFATLNSKSVRDQDGARQGARDTWASSTARCKTQRRRIAGMITAGMFTRNPATIRSWDELKHTWAQPKRSAGPEPNKAIRPLSGNSFPVVAYSPFTLQARRIFVKVIGGTYTRLPFLSDVQISLREIQYIIHVETAARYVSWQNGSVPPVRASSPRQHCPAHVPSFIGRSRTFQFIHPFWRKQHCRDVPWTIVLGSNARTSW